MPPSNGRKLQAPPCSTAVIGPRARTFLNRGIKFAHVQRNKIDHRMAEMGQTQTKGFGDGREFRGLRLLLARLRLRRWATFRTGPVERVDWAIPIAGCSDYSDRISPA
jgi:hypothetical protein